jgi:DNA ligase (NAD+)
MDIAGLGPSVVTLLLSNKLIKSAVDLYSLEYDDIINLDRMAETSANNLISAISNSKDRGLPRFIFAIGIPQVGAQTAKILAKELLSIDKLISATKEELEELDTVGPEIAESIVQFFNRQDILEDIEKFKLANIKLEEEVSHNNKELPLKGKTFVITGTLSLFKRKEAQEILERVGAKVSSSVSSKTTALIAGDNGGSKLQKAEKLGIEILKEEYIEQWK